MESCLDCVRKHLATAMCYLAESKLGYPERIWRCVGEMRLAEDEAAEQYPAFALTIRVERMRYLEHACDAGRARFVDAEMRRVVHDVFPGRCAIQDLIDTATGTCIVERETPIQVER